MATRDPASLASVDASLDVADLDGVFPEGFHVTTNVPTEVRVGGSFVPVEDIEMDVGIVVDSGRARAVPMHRIRRGDAVVIGDEGVRLRPHPVDADADADAGRGAGFRFMGSAVSGERVKAKQIADVAAAIRAAHAAGQRVLFVGGPAIVHGGTGPLLERLVVQGHVDVLFAGNALAAHDIESSMFGTSLGVDLQQGAGVPHGHQHHLRAINRVRRAGSIAEAVRQGLVTRGIMHACVTRGVPFVLAGSIRDDGPLPDVHTDVVAAVDAMRAHVRDVGVAILCATTLHAVATGNLLRADVATFCVDASAETVIKLVDRGTHQATGIVTDCAYFLGELVRALA